VSNVPIPDDHVQDVAAGDNLMGSPDEIKMAEVDAEDNSGQAKLSQTHTADNDEYFEVEAIKSCKPDLVIDNILGGIADLDRLLCPSRK
jgi:hypothetical protein